MCMGEEIFSFNNDDRMKAYATSKHVEIADNDQTH